MNRKRYTKNNVQNSQFYQMPKFLFQGEFKNGLSNDARILYSLLKDRHKLSIENDWVNEKGEVYLIFTRQEMQDMLGCSYNTAKKAIDQLKKLGLFEEERTGLNSPNHIFLTEVALINKGVSNFESPESQKLKVRSLKNCESGVSNFESQESQNLKPNNTDSSNTEDINNNLSIYPDNDEMDEMDKYNKIVAFLKNQISYDYLIQQYPYEDMIEDIFNIILDVLTTTKPIIHVAGDTKPRQVVQSVFSKLTHSHIEYVIDAVKNNGTTIKNIRAYLITALYNAPSTITTYYANLYHANNN